MPIPRSRTVAALFVLLAACGDYPESERWTAAAPVQVLDGVEGKPLFRIAPGEACRPVRDRAGKVDLYTEVACATGSGWVRRDSPFTVAGQ